MQVMDKREGEGAVPRNIAEDTHDISPPSETVAFETQHPKRSGRCLRHDIYEGGQVVVRAQGAEKTNSKAIQLAAFLACSQA